MNTTSQITLLHFNARSLFPKLDHLKVECEILKPHIVCITEIWLDKDITDDELLINGFKLLRLDRNRHGGGTALYIQNIFPHSVHFVGNCSLECIIVSILIASCKFCIGLFYRPPGSDIDILDNLYSALCNIDVSLFSHFILIGDFNVDVMSPNRPLFSKLMNITSSFLLSQIVTELILVVPVYHLLLTLPLYQVQPVLLHVTPSHRCQPQITWESPSHTKCHLQTSDHVPRNGKYGVTHSETLRKHVKCSKRSTGNA